MCVSLVFDRFGVSSGVFGFDRGLLRFFFFFCAFLRFFSAFPIEIVRFSVLVCAFCTFLRFFYVLQL